VNVIAHETVSQDFYTVMIRVVTQPTQVGVAICVGEKDLLATVAPLGDMVRDAGKDDAAQSWHVETILRASAARAARIRVMHPQTRLRAGARPEEGGRKRGVVPFTGRKGVRPLFTFSAPAEDRNGGTGDRATGL
jgi:hypothetical protein